MARHRREWPFVQYHSDENPSSPTAISYYGNTGVQHENNGDPVINSISSNPSTTVSSALQSQPTSNGHGTASNPIAAASTTQYVQPGLATIYPVQPSTGASFQPPHGFPMRVVLAVVIPMTLLAMGIVIACILRRRRRKHVLHEQVMAEFKYLPRDANSHALPPYTPSPSISIPLPPMSGADIPQAHVSAPAVVISPMAPAMGAAYYTGIDTSDVVSVAENNNHGDFDPDHGDEPPPPYRPRSRAAVSRETSLRHSEQAPLYRAQLSPGPEDLEQRTRSPFDDPENVVVDYENDTDAISMLSNVDEQAQLEHEHEHHNASSRLSDVSDSSYQNEPTTTPRNAV